MRFFLRRRRTDTAKESALATARKATAELRRSNAKAGRRRDSKQANPIEQMTPNQWIGGGGST